MSSSKAESPIALATKVVVTEDTLSADLADGRTISVPLAWFPLCRTPLRQSGNPGG
jgi:hypothetical protein